MSFIYPYKIYKIIRKQNIHKQQQNNYIYNINFIKLKKNNDSLKIIYNNKCK